MREAIHSVDRFKDFKIADEPHTSSKHAENNLAEMPSIIIETAFHTNAGDAELLKDAEFRKMSMMGVAKGYRLYAEGKSCERFAVTNSERSEAFVLQQASLPVKISGHPKFPVDIRYRPSRCFNQPCGVVGKLAYNSAGVDAFRLTYRCMREDVAKGPIDFLVSVKDTDGFSTEPVTFTLSCKARSR
jgi:hypothetical protein